MNIPRPEYPKPQFERENWLNLNGVWQFEIDNGRSGIDRGLAEADAKLSDQILVPFCPESKLSGIENTDFMYGVWYKRTVTLTEQQCAQRVVLHFGAVDYTANVFVNGQKVGTHKGGYISFAMDITKFVTPGENVITVFAEDDTRCGNIPKGKQAHHYHSSGCNYTRTTGIWQTVWLEFTPKSYIKSVKYYPDYKKGEVTVFAEFCGKGDFTANITYEGKPMASFCETDAQGRLQFTLSLEEIHLWEIGKGRLYDVAFTFGEDAVKSYFGLRNVELRGQKFLLNGKSVFQRTVLDQGFYPDGIYTAPSDEDLKNDILLSLACGFNGARPHEKIFEERYFYHADKLGYITWGEYPDWGLNYNKAENIHNIMPEWLEEIERDFNHPSIIGWCPRNEVWNTWWGEPHRPSLALLYDVTKAVDPTRPCIDVSGGFHVKTDIYDVHEYCQNGEGLHYRYDGIKDGVMTEHQWHENQIPYTGGPVFLSEYGGIAWFTKCDEDNDRKKAWGYGNGPKTEEEFIARFTELTETLMENPGLMGLCYTQLTDVEQEQNGLYTYDRIPKFDPEIFKKVLSKKAAIED
ncbi:MAG: glycoside hydrolase family 2 TIM barrel-domain containing protein [Acutalibacteraceae bacterium]|nr:glycoside hydrolase family 2 TIM barrel-domain containing protein [Acutalibacteraceae bacterium]